MRLTRKALYVPYTVARWPREFLLLEKHKDSKATLLCFVKWTADGFSFFCTTPGPISKRNICINSGDDHGAEISSGVGAPGPITCGVVPTRSGQCPGALLVGGKFSPVMLSALCARALEA